VEVRDIRYSADQTTLSPGAPIRGLAQPLASCDHRQVIESAALARSVLPTLRGLADMPFDMSVIRAVLEGLGEVTYQDTWLVGYRLPHACHASIAAADADALRVGALIVTIAAWDTLSTQTAPSAEAVAYNAKYDELIANLTDVIGQPDLRGTDGGDFPFRWNLWHGGTGVLVLRSKGWVSSAMGVGVG
jgi:hypothetical protein